MKENKKNQQQHKKEYDQKYGYMKMNSAITPHLDENDDLIYTLPNEGKGEIKSDVMGSFTGITDDGLSPVQDADDL